MAEENNDRRDKTITLTKLKPQEYRLWVITARATFDVYGVLDIVEGREPDPTPVNPDGAPGAINTQHRSKIQKWKRNHGLAREALLKALEPAELLKVGPVQGSAPEIWNRLEKEYGQVIRTEYVRALRAFYSYEKDDKTSMEDHINRFEKLLQDVEYTKPPTFQPRDRGEVNMAFMSTLGENWKTFLQAKGSEIDTMDMAVLYAEVRTSKLSRSGTQTTIPPQPPEAKALSTQFQGNRRGRGGGNSGYQRGRGRGRGRGGIGKRYSRPEFDPNKYCTRCEKQGHDITACWTAAKEREARNTGSSGTGNINQRESSSDRPYQPSFTRPRY